jgi:hypothetical protein
VNQETLDESDVRRGWPAPTVLIEGMDLFGSAPPQTTSMGCRTYAEGVPDVATIAQQLRAFQDAKAAPAGAAQPADEVSR